MAATSDHFMSALLTFGLLLMVSLDFTAAQIGVDYGMNGNGLPAPPQVVELYNRYGIQRMRIYDADHRVLQALRGSGIELTVGILNRDLQGIADSQDAANGWVRDNIQNYGDVRFRHIIVGNEVSPIRSETAQYVPFVLRAMENIYRALSAAGIGIKVTTAIETELVDPSSNFPPQNGVFRPEVRSYINPIIAFLVRTNAPLFATIYPYFAYLGNPSQIDVRYALLDPTFPGVDTPGGRYQNLFYALYDAVYSAVEKSVAAMPMELGLDAVNNVPEVVGGETGHSTRPGRRPPASVADDVNNFASVDNARAYVNNLIQAVKKGTPKRPGQPIETYIFAMFDEDQKPGDEDERNFGLFLPSGTPKYQVNFN